VPEIVETSEGFVDTLFGQGSVSAPGAGATIATLAAPPAGTYNLRITLGQGPAGTIAAADCGNWKITKSGASFIAAGLASNCEIVIDRITLDGATTITVNALVAATAGVVYTASIKATRVQ